MGARDRLFATVVIWGAFVITSVVLVDRTTGDYPNAMNALTLIVIMALMALAAVLGTFAVWRFWSREADCEKQRRRVARLTEQVDEEIPIDLEAQRVTREHRPER